MQVDDVISISELLLSKWGWHGWRLVFGLEEIIGWPYTWREGFSLGVLLETGIGRDAASALNTNDRDRFNSALLGRPLRTYSLSDIASITLRSSMARHKIEIHRANGTADIYSMWDRDKLLHYRYLLQKTYPHHYREEGFPNTRWGKFLRQ
jgi:hypothetical protein